jgi:hypothetical protein
LADVAVASASSRLHPIELVVEKWMNNDEVFEYSNLIVFSVSAGTTMALASNISRRPMGKPLPDVAATCSCPVDRSGGEKVWVVEHDARDGCLAKVVNVVARCSLCGRFWRLPTAGLAGTVKHVSGRYAITVGYYAKDGWL